MKPYVNKKKFEKAIFETERKYKDIIFENNIPTCTKCLNELTKQKVFDKRVHIQKLIEIKNLAWDSLLKNILVDDGMMIDKETGEVIGLAVDYTCYKKKFLVDFSVFIGH